MIAKIIITIILIVFFSTAAIAFISLIRQFKRKDKSLIIVTFISAVFSGYALIEFIKIII